MGPGVATPLLLLESKTNHLKLSFPHLETTILSQEEVIICLFLCMLICLYTNHSILICMLLPTGPQCCWREERSKSKKASEVEYLKKEKQLNKLKWRWGLSEYETTECASSYTRRWAYCLFSYDSIDEWGGHHFECCMHISSEKAPPTDHNMHL